MLKQRHFFIICIVITLSLVLPQRAIALELQSISSQAQDLSHPSHCHKPCVPTITFTSVPPFGSNENLFGRVDHVTPADYKVAVYIYVSGWWTKPTFASPLTTIQSDGTWTTDITTGGNDNQATKIAAFLVKERYTPPLMSGQATLPAELFDNAAAYVTEDREPVYRTIEFSGYTWNVKSSKAKVGPGPNYFSADENDVWVDEDGNLHLTISYKDGKWFSSEVFTLAPLGYGTYTFTLASPIDQLDKNAVLGLFTWDDAAPENNYREIDTEFSKWGNDSGENSQYVVQPYDHAGNIHRFDTILADTFSTDRKSVV